MKFLLLLFLTLLTAQGEYRCEVFAGTGSKGFSGDNGKAISAQLNNPYGLVRGPDGGIYICDTDNHRIRKVLNGVITTVAGNGHEGFDTGGPSLRTSMNEPYEVRFLGSEMYVVERMNHVVRSFKNGRSLPVIAGKSVAGFSGDGGPSRNSLLSQPHSIQFDSQGRLYICDIGNHRLRRVENGVITTIGGTGARAATLSGKPLAGNPLNGPRAIDFAPDGTLWLALREGNAIYSSDLKTITHVTGTGKTGMQDGPIDQATLSGPKGISVGPDGDIYFADTESHSIRKINLQSKMVERVAGTGKRGSALNQYPLETELNRPHGIFVDRDNSIFVGDSENHRVLLLKRLK